MKTSPVLLVEDDPNDVVLLRHAFEKSGVTAELIVARDGEEAIQLLDEAQQSFRAPALVLLDLFMPLVDGFEVLAWIRRQPRLADAPVVVFSGSLSKRDREKALRLGAKEFVQKPWESQAMTALVRRLFAKHVETDAATTAVLHHSHHS